MTVVPPGTPPPALEAPNPPSPTRPDRLTRECLLGAAVAIVPFLAVLWDFGLRPFRRMTADGLNADFFDIQARALFHGHLDVPAGSLGIEAFVVDGKHYMYFGLFPAILRMPILLVTDRLDGRLTALSMLLGWAVLAFTLSWLFGLVRSACSGDSEVDRREAFAFAALTASIAGGSVLLYVASQPWVYHEVYIWSAALTVGTTACLIAAWDRVDRRHSAITFAFTLATMLNRAPAGWAMSVAAIATGFWIARSRRDRADAAAWRRSGRLLVGTGVLSIVVGSAVNIAKFGHPYRFPIEKHVWSDMSAHRRIVLHSNDGRIDGLQFAATTLRAYFRPDGVRFVGHFPYITPPADPPAAVGDVVLDESFRTASITASMPLLLLLAIWGLVVVVRPGSAGVRRLRVPLLGTLVLTYGVIAFGYVAQRYTSEFVPVLALAGAVGVADIVRRLRTRPRWRSRVVMTVMAGLAVYGLVANVAISVVNARQRWRGDRLEQLVSLQLAISDVTGHPLDRFVSEVDELPDHGSADALAIVGDCDALYVGTGETSGSWIPVQFRDRQFRLAVDAEGLRPGSLRLMWFAGYTLRRLHVQVGLDQRIRLVLIGTPPDTAGRWLTAAPGDAVVIRVDDDTARNRFVATAVVQSDRPSSGLVSQVDAPMTEWDQRFIGVPITPLVVVGTTAEADAIGVRARVEEGPPPSLCESLRDG